MVCRGRSTRKIFTRPREFGKELVMRSMVLFICAMPLLAAGCTANFCGEWLEDGVKAPDGKIESVTGERRLALDFDPVSGMRHGRYDEQRGVVDNGTEQTDHYFVHDAWNKAQFGSMIARVDGEVMHAGIMG